MIDRCKGCGGSHHTLSSECLVTANEGQSAGRERTLRSDPTGVMIENSDLLLDHKVANVHI